jgi:hypothetical protein
MVGNPIPLLRKWWKPSAVRDYLTDWGGFGIIDRGGELRGDFSVNANQRGVGGKAISDSGGEFILRFERPFHNPNCGDNVLDTVEQLAVANFHIAEKSIQLVPAGFLSGSKLFQL